MLISVVYSNKILNRVTVSGDGNENRQKKSVGLIRKNTTLHVQHTFFVHFSTVVLHDYNVVFFSLPLIFTWVTASISHFLTAAIKFSRYSSNEQRNWSPLFFISCSSSFSDTHVRTLEIGKIISKSHLWCRDFVL